MATMIAGWSKKFTALLVFMALVLLNRQLDLGLTEDDIYALAGGTAGAQVGIGLADFGKEKAKIEEKK